MRSFALVVLGILLGVVVMLAVPHGVPQVVFAGSPCGNGDVNGDGRVDIADGIYIINYQLRSGPAPVPMEPPSCDSCCPPSPQSTLVFLVRHVEVDAAGVQTAAGRARVAELLRHFKRTRISHVYSSHLFWARDTAQPLAAAHGLDLIQLPSPDWTGPREDQIAPTVEALQNLPQGSTAVVVGHGRTLFGIMAGLGVKVHTASDPCEAGDTSCLPCDSIACFDGSDFDGLWVVSLDPSASGETAMARLDYGP